MPCWAVESITVQAAPLRVTLMLLHGAGWTRQFKGHRRRGGNQIVIASKTYTARDAIMQADRKTRRLREKAQVRRLVAGTTSNEPFSVDESPARTTR
jgi:hypothetical protein